MKLFLDIGNTRIKWAFETQGELSFAGEFVHRDKNSSEISGFVDQFEKAPETAVGVNVAGEEIGSLVAEALMQRFNCRLQFVKTTARVGNVKNGYRAVEQLGTDRWAALVAAWHRHRQAVCVVDAGSALTIDLVGSDGQHFGGVIIPGLLLMQGALKADTSDIAGFATSSQLSADSANWFANDTASALVSGSMFAAVSAIESAVAEFPEADVAPELVLTGGDAPLLLDRLRGQIEYRPLLVLEGLKLLAEESG